MHSLSFPCTPWLKPAVQEFRELEEMDRGQKNKVNFPADPWANSTYKSMLHQLRFYTVIQIISSWSLNGKHSSVHQGRYSSKSPETHAQGQPRQVWRYVHMQANTTLAIHYQKGSSAFSPHHPSVLTLSQSADSWEGPQNYMLTTLWALQIQQHHIKHF